ncbi:hypothetical protein GOBAR_AA24437 [Gossypium barbadense]|uniref:Uncharacterized protein n=1 Tax=Gossypium barbadense TaxID=3634 RepID=A0A2P5WYW6_GOSBA|nr:hypothetical protein GOBAR_AA24437 [Gossypium barbadense]
MRRRRLRDLSIVQNTPNSEEANSEQQTVVGSLNVPETLDEPAEFQSYLGIISRNANMLPINYESWHHMPDSNKNQALDNIKDRERVGTSNRQKQKFTYTAGSRSFASIADAEEISSGQKVGRLQLFEITYKKKDGSPMTSEAGEIMEKKVEYEANASTDSSVNLENIDNIIINEVLGPESRAQAEVQRLKDQIAQMKANTVEQIAKVQRKYAELQQQLRVEAAKREAGAAAREAVAVAREVEQSKKYDELQLQLQQMMQMLQ